MRRHDSVQKGQEDEDKQPSKASRGEGRGSTSDSLAPHYILLTPRRPALRRMHGRTETYAMRSTLPSVQRIRRTFLSRFFLRWVRHSAFFLVWIQDTPHPHSARQATQVWASRCLLCFVPAPETHTNRRLNRKTRRASVGSKRGAIPMVGNR